MAVPGVLDGVGTLWSARWILWHSIDLVFATTATSNRVAEAIVVSHRLDLKGLGLGLVIL